MGLFSGITKVFKKVVKGIKTGFKSILKPFGKLMKNKLFKGIMLAATIWTGVGAIISAGMTSAGTWSLTEALSAGAKFVTDLPAKILSAPGKILNSVKDGLTGAVEGAQNILTPTTPGTTGLSQGLEAANQGSEVMKAAGASAASTAPDVSQIVSNVAGTQAPEMMNQASNMGSQGGLLSSGAGSLSTPAIPEVGAVSAGQWAAPKASFFNTAKDVAGGLLSKGGDALKFMNENAEGLNFASNVISPMFEQTPVELQEEYWKMMDRRRGNFSDEQIAGAGQFGYGY